ncbi:hypothetical protein ACOMHN_021197 [Nucella lapillus]
MFDVALSSGGAQIILSTSSDDDHPPENMIDGTDESFWTTTGMFPQEVIIRFQALMNIQKVELTSCNVNNVVFETCETENVDAFEPLAERELDPTDQQTHTEEMNVGDRKAQCLRMVINSAHDHFVAVYKLKINGTALHG